MPITVEDPELRSQRTHGDGHLLQGIGRPRERDHRHRERQRTDAARDTRRRRRVETDSHRGSARTGRSRARRSTTAPRNTWATPATATTPAAADSGASIDVGGGYMLVAGDESNVIKPLSRSGLRARPSRPGTSTASFPTARTEVNIHGVARAGNTIYCRRRHGQQPTAEKSNRPTTPCFAATITGSGASTELDYLGSYIGLREDLIAWDNANGAPLGLAASTAPGQRGRGRRRVQDRGRGVRARLEHRSVPDLPLAAGAAPGKRNQQKTATTPW